MVSILNRYDAVRLVALAVLAVVIHFITPATRESNILSADKEDCGVVGVTDPSSAVNLESFETLAADCR